MILPELLCLLLPFNREMVMQRNYLNDLSLDSLLSDDEFKVSGER